MKKTFLTTIFMLSALTIWAQKAKYVFYFITDGTGVNIVQGAEHYRADISAYTRVVNGDNNPWATKPFSFTQFPVVGMATTFSASSRVTDSAASGTALATGRKTTNQFVGVLPDKTTPVYSILKKAKAAGMATGVGTSVSIDHATPAAFYAHNSSRKDYHNIGHDLVNNDYVDFFGGSNFCQPTSKNHPGEADLYTLAEKAGITVAYGKDEYNAKAKKAKRMLLVQPKAEMTSDNALKYAIERGAAELSIEDILRAELDFLVKADKGKGFLLMNEIGGKVDWADHSNDAATAFAELEAVDRCVQIALEFYKQHPDETLIVMTSDHDTGGPSLGSSHYTMNLKALSSQKISKDSYTTMITDMRRQTNNNVTWEMIEKTLRELWGFWTVHKLTEAQEKLLKDVYAETLGKNGASEMVKDEYKENERMSDAACRVISQIAEISYVHGGHTAGYVPVYAIGVGADSFKGMNDNTQIPQKIAAAIGFSMENK